LAHHGAVIWRERAAWVADSAPALARLAAAIGESATVAMRYGTAIGRDTAIGQDAAIGRDTRDASDAGASDIGSADIERAMTDALAEGRAHDIRRGMTRVGVHRDDLVLSLEGHDLRAFGSAGQQRTVAIALRMLEAETLERRIGVAPVFLLDDPFAELDVERARRILALLRERGRGQTVLTVPRAGDIPAELTTLERWKARSGEITRDG